MSKRKPAAPKTDDPAPGLSHGEVMDFVTGGASAWAARQHEESAKRAPRVKSKTKGAAASKLKPSSKIRLSVSIGEDLHLRLKSEAARRKMAVGEVLEQVMRRHLKG